LAKNKLSLAIDFDGTIVEHEFPEIGPEVPGAFEWLRCFQEAGISLILWTIRSDSSPHGDVLTEAVDYCAARGIIFAGVNGTPGQDSWSTSPKAYAQFYVDDAAIGCPLVQNPRSSGRPYVDWSVVGPMCMRALGV